MKKILLFLVCCILFISCGQINERLFDKNEITVNEFTEYVKNLEKEKYYEALKVDFLNKDIKFPKKEFNLRDYKISMEQYLNTHRKNKAGIGIHNSQEFIEWVELRDLNIIFNKEEPIYYKPYYITCDIYDFKKTFKAGYVKNGIIKTSNSKKTLNYYDIKSNKVNSILLIRFNDDKTYKSISYFKTDKLKNIKDFKINSDVLIYKIFENENNVFRLKEIFYKLLTPIKDKTGKEIVSFY